MATMALKEPPILLAGGGLKWHALAEPTCGPAFGLG